MPVSPNNSSAPKSIPTSMISFFVSSFLFSFLFIISGLLGPNGGSIYAGDNINRCIPFIQSFLRVVHGEENFWYSYSLFLGSETALTYLYFCMSPFNLIYLIPGISIVTAAHTITILKAGCAAASFSYFSSNTLKTNKLSSVLFAMCWGLSSWSVTMYFNYMWADSLYVLPLLISLIDKNAKLPSFSFKSSDFDTRKKSRISFILLILCFSYLYLTNFYMGYIITLYSLLIYIFIQINDMHDNGCCTKDIIRNIIKKLFRFFATLLISIGLIGIVFVPAAIELLKTDSLFASPGATLSASIPDLFTALFMNSASRINNGIPTIYCSIPALIFLIYFFRLESISKFKKITAIIIFTIFICSSLAPSLYSIWQFPGFQDSYSFVFSPCIVFSILCCAAISHKEIHELAPKPLLITITVLSLFYAVMVLFQDINGILATSDNYWFINTLFLLLWAAYILNMGKVNNSRLRNVIPFILLSIELTVNGYCNLTATEGKKASATERFLGTMIASSYASFSESLKTLSLSDGRFSRVSLDNSDNFNAASLYDARTLTSYGITDNSRLRSVLSVLGIANEPNRTYDIGGQSFTDMLFGIRYHIKSDGTIHVNSESLPIAFMSSASISDFNNVGSTPFEAQEHLACALSGKDVRLFETISGNSVNVYAFDEDIFELSPHTAYKHLSDIIINPWVSYYIEDKENHETLAWFDTGTYSYDSPAPELNASFTGIATPTTVESGSVVRGNDKTPYPGVLPEDGKDYSTWTMLFKQNGMLDYALNGIHFAYLDKAALSALYNELSKGSMNITEFSDSSITGTVVATEDRPILFTTIPYSEGWHAYIDGQPSKVLVVLNGAFCALIIPPGEHLVTFEYTAPGFLVGAVISLVSVFILLLLILTRPDSKKYLRRMKK